MWEAVYAFLGALGGGAVIIGGFAHFLGKVWAKRPIQDEKAKLDKELESHKVSLRKSEFIFEKEYDAASELVAYYQGLIPLHYHPDMDWSDVCEDVALGFPKIEQSLNRFLGKHGAILTKSAVEYLEDCIYLAGTHKHNVHKMNVSSDAHKGAEMLLKSLEAAKDSLIDQVRGQSSAN